MNAKTRALPFAFALLGTLLVAGCVTDTRVAAGPARATAVVAAPPPPPVVVAQPVYVPQPYDAYVSVALDRDVVYVGGSTYIWIMGPDGHRHRRYYGRGDLRGEILHRRAQLRVVMAHNDGHLPMQHARGAESARVRVTMQPHEAPPHGWHPPSREAYVSHEAREAHRAPGSNASANANAGGHHRRPDGHPDAVSAPRLAGQPPRAG